MDQAGSSEGAGPSALRLLQRSAVAAAPSAELARNHVFPDKLGHRRMQVAERGSQGFRARPLRRGTESPMWRDIRSLPLLPNPPT